MIDKNHLFYNEIVEKSKKYGVDPELMLQLANQESGGSVGATSPKGAAGIFQLMPATATGLGVTDIYDPHQNIDGGIRYFKQQLDENDGDVRLAAIGYNAGPGTLKEWKAKGIVGAGNYENIPYKETRNYVKKINDWYANKGSQAPQAQALPQQFGNFVPPVNEADNIRALREENKLAFERMNAANQEQRNYLSSLAYSNNPARYEVKEEEPEFQFTPIAVPNIPTSVLQTPTTLPNRLQKVNQRINSRLSKLTGRLG
jgi:membrane-bound lytic murein transglycosylase MltF